MKNLFLLKSENGTLTEVKVEMYFIHCTGEEEAISCDPDNKTIGLL